jgi:hypothetical protein
MYSSSMCCVNRALGATPRRETQHEREEYSRSYFLVTPELAVQHSREERRQQVPRKPRHNNPALVFSLHLQACFGVNRQETASEKKKENY